MSVEVTVGWVIPRHEHADEYAALSVQARAYGGIPKVEEPRRFITEGNIVTVDQATVLVAHSVIVAVPKKELQSLEAVNWCPYP